MDKVKVRFAPSPTGYLHLGGARTALFNWLFARQMKGKFVLRIEDTDKERHQEDKIKQIISSLEWLGMKSDEEIIFQSDNVERHKAATFSLLKQGKAYYDFTPAGETHGYDEAVTTKIKRMNPYRDLPIKTAEVRSLNEPYCIRLKVPVEGQTEFDDMVFGHQVRNYDDIEDLVLIRTNGSPLYNLAVVEDDFTMGITHVIRGQDHLTNTHKQVLLYEMLGYDKPVFAHLPLIFAPGKVKLSKRVHGAISAVDYYRDLGISPRAMLNYLALLGWSPGGNAQYLSLEDLVDKFSFARVNKAPATIMFNEQAENIKKIDPKLLHLSSEHWRKTSIYKLTNYVNLALFSNGSKSSIYDPYTVNLLPLYLPRAKVMGDFVDPIVRIQSRNFSYPEELCTVDNSILSELIRQNINVAKATVSSNNNEGEYFTWIEDNTNHIDRAELHKFVRLILTGAENGPAPAALIAAIGIDSLTDACIKFYREVTGDRD